MLLQCSFADCVNYKKSQEPFYLHHPSSAGGHLQQQQQHQQHQHQYQQQQQQNGTGRGKVAVKDGLYVVSPAAAAVQQQQQHQQQIVAGKTVAPAATTVTVEPVKQQQQQQQGPFYLHSPNEAIDDPVKNIFAADKTAAKTTAYVAPPPPPLPAIGLNTMTGKPRSIISTNIILWYTTVIAYRRREICTILFLMFFL